jgi:hypothetical protein
MLDRYLRRDEPHPRETLHAPLSAAPTTFMIDAGVLLQQVSAA